MKTDYAALHWVYEIHGQWSTHPLQCRIFPHTMDWTCAGAEAAWVHGLWCSGSMSAQSIMFRVNECTVGLWCSGSMSAQSIMSRVNECTVYNVQGQWVHGRSMMSRVNAAIKSNHSITVICHASTFTFDFKCTAFIVSRATTYQQLQVQQR